jgi:hypothetical protein
VPIVAFQRVQAKDDVAAWYRARFHQPQGVVFIQRRQKPRIGLHLNRPPTPPVELTHA